MWEGSRCLSLSLSFSATALPKEEVTLADEDLNRKASCSRRLASEGNKRRILSAAQRSYGNNNEASNFIILPFSPFQVTEHDVLVGVAPNTVL